ncbi:MAG: hypothetical protein JOZ58_02090, partial [Acetobacteraceae bacterium]|nr:hypothetical protein [Acetobacteraceae bacterium]
MGGLVEQQKAWLLRQLHRDFEEALIAMREKPRGTVGDSREAQPFECEVGPPPRGRKHDLTADKPPTPALASLGSKTHILARAHLRKQRGQLERARDAALADTREVRLFAPYAFRDVLERAVTADDYATLAADNARRLAERPNLMPPTIAGTPLPAPTSEGDPRAGEEEEPGEAAALPSDICLVPFRPLQSAKGTFRWNGSWYEALVAVDPLGTETVDSELLAEIAAYLAPYRRIGHDLDVRSPD